MACRSTGLRVFTVSEHQVTLQSLLDIPLRSGCRFSGTDWHPPLLSSKAISKFVVEASWMYGTACAHHDRTSALGERSQSSDSLRTWRSASDRVVATASVQPAPTRSWAFGTPPEKPHRPITSESSGNLERRRLHSERA